jgi:hypothetical protein
MNVYQIPLTTDPDQRFQSTIPINGINKTLSFRLRYDTEQLCWWLSITDTKTSILLIDSMPLVTGVTPADNLLGQHQYLNIGSATIIPTEQLSTQDIDRPDDSNLGTKYWLVWSDNAD